jgi:hypothetical protein
VVDGGLTFQLFLSTINIVNHIFCSVKKSPAPAHNKPELRLKGFTFRPTAFSYQKPFFGESCDGKILS